MKTEGRTLKVIFIYDMEVSNAL